MSETWYRLNRSYAVERIEIEAVEAEKSTEHTVTVSGRRRDKAGTFFATPEAAKDYEVNRCYVDVQYAKLRLARAQSALDVAKNIGLPAAKEAK